MKIKVLTQVNNYINQKITIEGWVNNIRNHGELVFIDIRKNNEVIQTIWKKAPPVAPEYILRIQGIVGKRSATTINKKIATGTLEILVEDYQILSRAKARPIPIIGYVTPENQQKYRILYLRRQKMQKILKLRNDLVFFTHKYFQKHNFLNINTPLLTASSPEGARDFLVPSRRFKNCYYALPQSPQIFKQLLMASAVEKYYQIAPCFRDEDSRKDRHTGEFYQIDIEMAFTTQKEALNYLEDFVTKVIECFNPKAIKVKTFSYQEAIDFYGTDKPDIRLPRIEDRTEEAKQWNCQIFSKAIREEKVIRSITVDISQYKNLLKFINKNKIQAGYIYKNKSEYGGSLAKFIPKTVIENNKASFFFADSPLIASQTLHKIASILPKDDSYYSMVFITDFPMFEWKDNKWEFVHNPFSNAVGDLSDPATVMSEQYDLVLNGFELASGAIRNRSIEKLIKCFEVVGYNREEVKKNFALYDSFQYGVPPHGGWAIGLERLLMILSNSSLLDVIAFPLNTMGRCHLTNCPRPI